LVQIEQMLSLRLYLPKTQFDSLNLTVYASNLFLCIATGWVAQGTLKF